MYVHDFFISVHVKFSQRLYSVMESDGNLQGTVVLSGPLKRFCEITIKCTSPGNATCK